MDVYSVARTYWNIFSFSWELFLVSLCEERLICYLILRIQLMDIFIPQRVSVLKYENAVKNETQRLKEETDGIMKEKGHVCSMIVANQRKMASLDSDSSTLSQVVIYVLHMTHNLEGSAL